MILRFQYLHETTLGESPTHNAALRDFIQQWLRLPDNESFGGKWSAGLVKIGSESGLPRKTVAVKARINPSLPALGSSGGIGALVSRPGLEER